MKIKPITQQDADKAYETVKDNGNPQYGDKTYALELCRFDDGKALYFCAGTLYDGDEFEHYCRLGIENPNAVLADFEFDYPMPWDPNNEYGDVIDTELSLPIGQDDVEWLNEKANNIADGYESGELVASACGKKKGKRKPVKSAKRPIQSMYVTQDISGNDLYTCLWSGGKDQFDSMIEDGADADDILNACEELLFREEGNPPTMTELNDLIWFEPDTIRDYIGLSNPIESGCHGKSKKKGKKKAVKSAAQISEIHNATSDCFVRITRSDVPEVGKVNDTIPLYEFKDSCRSYAETTNGSYYVTMDDTYEGEYFVEFSTGDTTFAPEDQRDDPYYNESLGTLQFEVIWNPGQELCTYLNNE